MPAGRVSCWPCVWHVTPLQTARHHDMTYIGSSTDVSSAISRDLIRWRVMWRIHWTTKYLVIVLYGSSVLLLKEQSEKGLDTFAACILEWPKWPLDNGYFNPSVQCSISCISPCVKGNGASTGLQVAYTLKLRDNRYLRIVKLVSLGCWNSRCIHADV